MKKIYTPLIKECIESLKAGDEVLLEGVIYTARDLAHQELTKAAREKGKLPVCLRNQVLYYCGPTSCPQGRAIGSCGPTTASRMDSFTIDLLKMGVKGMIGKGARSPEVVRAIKKYGAVYFIAVGGAGALLSTRVTKARVAAYKRFGPEAIYKLQVKDFPLIVGVDSQGKDIYIKGDK